MTVPSPHGMAQEVRYNAGGSLLAVVGRSSAVPVYAIPGGELRYTVSGGAAEASASIFSLDGRHLYVADDAGVVRQFDAANGTPGKTFERVDHGISRLAVSPDGTRIAAASAVTYLFDTAHGLRVATLRPNGNAQWHLSFSPDGAQLFTSAQDSRGAIAVHDTLPLRERLRARSAAPR